MTSSQHVYEVRRRKDHRGVDLISDAPEYEASLSGMTCAAFAAKRAVLFGKSVLLLCKL